MHATAELRARLPGRLHTGALLLLVLAACGAPAPPAPPPAVPLAPAAPPRTVFDDLTSKRRELPAAVDEAQRQHGEATQRSLDAAEGGGRDEPAR